MCSMHTQPLSVARVDEDLTASRRRNGPRQTSKMLRVLESVPRFDVHHLYWLRGISIWDSRVAALELDTSIVDVDGGFTYLVVLRILLAVLSDVREVPEKVEDSVRLA